MNWSTPLAVSDCHTFYTLCEPAQPTPSPLSPLSAHSPPHPCSKRAVLLNRSLYCAAFRLGGKSICFESINKCGMCETSSLNCSFLSANGGHYKYVHGKSVRFHVVSHSVSVISNIVKCHGSSKGFSLDSSGFNQFRNFFRVFHCFSCQVLKESESKLCLLQTLT